MRYTKNGFGVNRSLYCYTLTDDITGNCVKYGLVSARSGAEAIGIGISVARRRGLTDWTSRADKVYGKDND